MRSLAILATLTLLIVSGCGTDRTMAPQAPSSTAVSPAVSANGRTEPGQPGYEPAYVGGNEVTINAILVPNRASAQAMADFYEVVYPIGWEQMGLAPPQCNPCDHDGNGIDFLDYHDHVLDSMPSSPGHGEFTPLWHVFVVVPAYNHVAAHDAAVGIEYSHHLAAKSESEVDALLNARMPDGSPVAVEIDTDFYFLCAVVSQNAAK